MNRIISTTDGQFLGRMIDVSLNPVDFGEGICVFVESVINTATGVRLVSSTYIIDADEVPNAQDYQ